MPVTVEQAKVIMQATTIDILNTASQPERRNLMEQFFSPSIKTYAPDGSVTTGYDQFDEIYDSLHADGRQEWWLTKGGDIWLHGNAIMQPWVFGKGEEEWKGWDIILLGDDGKVVTLYGLVNGEHNHAV